MNFNVFALPEGPNMAPHGSQTASEFNIGLKIYTASSRALLFGCSPSSRERVDEP